MTFQYQLDTARDRADLEQIVALQRDNLLTSLSADEARTQGFLSVKHDVDTLERMNGLAPSLVVRGGPRVVAYALTMSPESRALCPVLEPMFQRVETLELEGRPLTDHRYYVMGQICIDKAHRGRGLFEQLYTKHRELYAPRFDLLLTTMATRNMRSMRAHERLGLKVVSLFEDQQEEWAIVLWDWRGT